MTLPTEVGSSHIKHESKQFLPDMATDKSEPDSSSAETLSADSGMCQKDGYS